ncbi:peptidoglycan-binding protein [Alteribacillus sp. HJP-4]|uniref:C40 family peptidase n=1 Tax=Alteribacillus sp. HJP-4 TaxID=2775394 RepID=UPI0035CD23DD
MLDTTTRMQKIVVTSTAVTGAIIAAPIAADAALGDDTLREGSSSDDVKKLQDLLTDKGHYTYLTSTGYFGERTKEAVKRYQREHNLMVDGIAGPQTFGVLLTDSGKSTSSTASSEKTVKLGSSTILRVGDKSDEVKELQRQLKNLGHYSGELNSQYGRQLSESVKSFQREEKIKVDGIAGPQTFAALKGASPTAPSSSSKSSTFKVLSSGDRGSEVSSLQQQLKDLGFYKKDVTGIYGPDTESAVRSFQRANSISGDGLSGPQTFNKLENNPKKASSASSGNSSSSNSSSSSGSTLRYQSQGQDVTDLQNQLKQLGFMKMNATGIFGDVTEKAVRSFQSKYGLTVDGIAGPQTFGKLKEMTGSGSSNNSGSSSEKKSSSNSKINVTNLLADAATHMGTPYVWGGTSTSGFDCSGFIQYVFRDNGVSLPRTVAQMHSTGTSISSPRVGDLVFFETYTSGPSHAGIYLGNNQFIHAGSSTGVTVANMTSSYWKERYLGAKRYF